MGGTADIAGFLNRCSVDRAVFELRPDYRAMLVVVDGLCSESPRSAQRAADELVSRAQTHAHALLNTAAAEDLPHIAAWRDAFRAFGAKPQRTRNSLEALTRRAGDGLPRVNPVTDTYNAISVIHQVPLGGEDLDCYRGAARLVRACGDEVFDTLAAGEPMHEHPEPGEVIWRDDAGVTCRRWNWRQGRRTRLTESTRTALFILDALAPMSDQALADTADALADAMSRLGSRTTDVRRLIAPA